MMGLEFSHSFVLLALLLLPFLYYVRYSTLKKRAITISPMQYQKVSALRKITFHIPIVLELLTAALLLFSLAGPYRLRTQTKISEKGVDIAFVLDVSLSMQADDFSPTRLEAMKEMTKKFLRRIYSDRVAIYIFAGHTFTQTPLSDDTSVAEELLSGIAYESIDHYRGGGTAIGNALLLAVEGLKNERIEKRDQVIILLSDGESNAGVDPELAVKYLLENDISLYVIGIGSDEEKKIYVDGEAVYNTLDQHITTIFAGEELEKLAAQAGGRYFHAKNEDLLSEILDDIARLEKSPLESTTEETRYSYSPHWGFAAFLAFLGYLSIVGLMLRRPFR